jgi:hypothetical protein
MHPKLSFPSYDCKLKKDNGEYYILDGIRKKYLKLTREEWVRQHLIHFLVEHKNYPKSLISLERKTEYKERTLRTDLIAYNTLGIPLILAECKAYDVKLDQTALHQISNYNRDIGARFLLLTNGLDHYVLSLNRLEKKWEFLQQIPSYTEE